MTNLEQSRRVRIGGGNGKWLGIVVLLGAALLGLMITLGNLDPPVVPTPTPLLVAPAPSPKATPTIPVTPTPRFGAAGRIYLLTQGSPGVTKRTVQVLDAATNETLYTIADVLDLALSADGHTVYTLYPAAIVASDAGTLAETWRASLRPMAGSTQHQISRLALSHDGGTVLVLRQSVDAVGIWQSWLEQLSAANGTTSHELIELNQTFSRPTLIAGDANSVIVADFSLITQINLATAESHVLFDQSSGPFAVGLAAGQNMVYVANNDSVLTAMSRFNLVEQRRSVQYAPSLLPTFGPDTLAVAPNGELVAIALQSRRAAPIESASASITAFVLALLDPKTGKIVQQVALPTDTWATSLAYSSDGTTVYFIANNAVYAWDLAVNRLGNSFTIVDYLERMLVGPAVPFAAPAPTTSVPPATPTAIPTITPLTQPDAAPVAWLWPLNNSDNRQNIAVYHADGSSRIIAERVLAFIPRPQTTPLLLSETSDGAWQVLDHTAGTTTTLQTSQNLSTLANLNARFLLSPDGTSIAFISERDPITTDTITAPTQLVIADVRSGATRSVVDVWSWNQLYRSELAEWADDGIYLFSAGERLNGLYTTVWRIDSNAAQFTPKKVYQLPEPQDGWIQLNAQAGVLLSEPASNDPNLPVVPISVYDLRSNTQQTILFSVSISSINRGHQVISPDGAYLAYVRRSPDDGRTELVLYNRASQTEHTLARNLPSWGGGNIFWSGDHTLHMYAYDQPTLLSLFNEQVWSIDAAGEPQLTEGIASRTTQLSGQLTSDLLSRRTSVDFIWSEGYAVLRRIQLDPTPTLEVVLPLPLRLSPNSPFNSDMQIVYIP